MTALVQRLAKLEYINSRKSQRRIPLICVRVPDSNPDSKRLVELQAMAEGMGKRLGVYNHEPVENPQSTCKLSRTEEPSVPEYYDLHDVQSIPLAHCMTVIADYYRRKSDH